MEPFVLLDICFSSPRPFIGAHRQQPKVLSEETDERGETEKRSQYAVFAQGGIKKKESCLSEAAADSKAVEQTHTHTHCKYAEETVRGEASGTVGVSHTHTGTGSEPSSPPVTPSSFLSVIYWSGLKFSSEPGRKVTAFQKLLESSLTQ